MQYTPHIDEPETITCQQCGQPIIFGGNGICCQDCINDYYADQED